MTEHTALPWIFKDGAWIIGPAGNRVAEVYNWSTRYLANGEFIVTACNCHADLLEALKNLLASSIYADGEGMVHVSEGGLDDYDHRAMVERCKQAIRKATE